MRIIFVDAHARTRVRRCARELKNFFCIITIKPTETITDCRDPKDNKFLELAVASNAPFIITGDDDLLVLNPYRDINILKSGDFLALELV